MKDMSFLEELMAHMSPLVQEGLCEIFTDKQLEPGQQWDVQIMKALEQADVVLFLISSDFIDSDYIYQKEVQQALKRYRYGKSIIIPVIVRSADWQSLPINRFATLPKDGLPIASQPDRDLAWRKGVVQPLSDLFHKLLDGRIALTQSEALESARSIPSASAPVFYPEELDKELRRLMHEDHLEEAFDKLIQHLKGTRDEALKDVVLLWSRYNTLKRNSISSDDYGVAVVQVQHSLLKILDRLHSTNISLPT